MPTWKALELCPELIVLPARGKLYREVSEQIRGILARYTPVIEPLSLDEAYLDVSDRLRPAADIAGEIRLRIQQETGLTASAGVAPNKMLAKIASDWKKPDGLHVLTEDDIPAFMRTLPVRKIWGIGPRASERLARLGIETCGQLQSLPPDEMTKHFGRFGVELYELARGQDPRPVRSSRERKSMSSERTFSDNVSDLDECQLRALTILEELQEDLGARATRLEPVTGTFIKLKFADFTTTTVDRAGAQPQPPVVRDLVEEGWHRGGGRAVRLIGVGVRFARAEPAQIEMPLAIE
jgi:DNA polymerase-4